METGVEVGWQSSVTASRKSASAASTRLESTTPLVHAVENQRVNVIGAEDHGEVGAGKGTDAMLGDDNFAVFRCDDRGDRSVRLLEQFLILRRGFNGAEEDVSRTDLREPGPKSDLDMDNGHAGGTRVIEDACGTSQESVFVVFGGDGNDPSLAIQAENADVSRIDRKCSGLCTPKRWKGSSRTPS
jgi:hypothetical protein